MLPGFGVVVLPLAAGTEFFESFHVMLPKL
jgi:hypothetical protein